MIFFIFAENLTVKKDLINKIGDWFLDIAKYVTTAGVISTFLGGFESKFIMYFIGLLIIVSTFGIGVFLNYNKKKINKK